MPIQRKCVDCSTVYPATATVCGKCPDSPPAVIVKSTKLDAELKVGVDLTAGTVKGTAQYTIDSVLGYGNMATAYLVTDGLNLKVIKEMLPSANPKKQKKLEDLFLREATIQETVGNRISSRRMAFQPLPKGYGWFQFDNRLFMVMDFMDGMDLEKYMKTLKTPMPTTEALRLTMEIALVLKDFLHGHVNAGVPEPIIHRDIKPSNIQRVVSGNACLLDFGLARHETFSHGTQLRGGTIVAGTDGFQPPEQKIKGAKMTISVDLYALCATLYALLANDADGLADDRAEQEKDIRSKISDPDLIKLLIKGTHEDVRGRYKNAQELGRELARIYEKTQQLPNHLQAFKPAINPAAPTPARRVPQPLPTPVQPVAASTPALALPQYELVWEKSKVKMLNDIQFRKDCVGRVFNVLVTGSKRPVSGATIKVTQIVDTGHTAHNSTANVTTDGTGLFRLSATDTTVPVTVSKRTLYLEIKDSIGTVILGSSVDVKRPKLASAEALYEKAKAYFNKAPLVVRVIISCLLYLASCLGFYQNQTWLILFPLGLLPLCYKYKSAQGWTLAIIVSFTAEAITLAVCLSQFRQFLNWLGG